MDMSVINSYIVILVVLFCLCVGYVIKHLIPSDKINRFIPLIMAVLGLVINLWVNAWSFTAEIVLGGMISGLASTGLYEAFSNLISKGGLK